MVRYALVIGIANYEKISPNLPKAVIDAEAIAQILEKQGNFQDVERLPKRWIKDENRWEVAQDKKLTAKDLGEALKMFLLEKAKHQEALIYFAGHGLEVASWTDEKKGFLATYDCSSDGRYGILLDDLNKLISKSEVSNLVMLLDCCHAGYALERKLLDDSLTAFGKKTDYYLITACRGFEKALEAKEHGVFTGAVLRGLGDENADEDGRVSGDRLFDFITSELKGSGQEPIRMGWGRSITLVQYQPKQKEKIVKEDCPYQGLRYFGEKEKEFFFGREKVIQLLWQKLGQANFVPIIGASGSGKSSVVRAGLIPKLKENGWELLAEPILPGVEPLAELKRAFNGCFERSQLPEIYSLIEKGDLAAVIERLKTSPPTPLLQGEGSNSQTLPFPCREGGLGGLGHRLLLVIDQFEEVFTLRSLDKDQQTRRFIELLTKVAEIPDSRLAIVTTMRADFLEYCLSYESLTELIQNQAVYMPPLLGAEFEEAIAKPAHLQGYDLETGLLGAILDDVGKEKDCLPLLQFALTELWEKRDNQKHQLSLEQYQVLGGVTGALNRHAEKVYGYKDFQKDVPQKERTAAEQEWIKLIFLRLVRTGEGEKDTKQRQPKAKLLGIAKDNLADEKVINDILDELICGRLLVSGEEGVDLAHEALIEGWQRFVEWRQESCELRRLIDRINDAFREWDKQPTDDNLMMGGLLAQAREKWLEIESDLDDKIRDFYQQSNSHEQDRIAELQQALTESRLREQVAIVLNLLPFQPVDALVLAIQTMGENVDKLPKKILSPILTSLHRVMETARVSIPFQGHQGYVSSVAFSPDGEMIVSGSEDSTVRLWNLEGNPIGKPFQGHKGIVSSVAFSPDGQMIVSGSWDKTLRLWDLQGNLISQIFMGHEYPVFCVAFSPDGQMIASGSNDETVRLWDTKGNTIGQPFQGHDGSVYSVAFSPDGQMIVSAGQWDKTLRLWDLQGNPIVNYFQGHDGFVNSAAFSPNGQMIVSCSTDLTIRLWDTKGHPITDPLQGHKNVVTSVAFSPDGQMIISSSDDGTLRFWDIQGNPVAQPLQYYEGSPSSVAFSPNGQMIVSGSYDNTVLLLCLQGNQIGSPFEGHKFSVQSVAFSPNGQMIVTGSDDKTVRLWDLQGNPIGSPFEGHESSINSLAFSPNGQMIVTGSNDKTVRLWDLRGNQIGSPFRGHEHSVHSVAFSPDGQLIVSGSGDATVRLWDLRGNQIGSPFRGYEYSVYSVAFSPDGQLIVSGSGDETVRLWDLRGNQIGSPFRGHEHSVYSVAFSPDGQLIVSGSGDATVRLWDLRGNQIGSPFRGHKSSINSVAFSPDGQFVVTGSWDNTVRLWRGSWRAWLEVCCNRLRYHPIFKNPQTEEAKAACEVCQKYVWSKNNPVQ